MERGVVSEREPEYVPDALSDEDGAKLREVVMLTAPPHEGAHLAGICVVSLWHKLSEDDSEEGQRIESSMFVSPSEQTLEVMHATVHIILRALEHHEGTE